MTFILSNAYNWWFITCYPLFVNAPHTSAQAQDQNFSKKYHSNAYLPLSIQKIVVNDSILLRLQSNVRCLIIIKKTVNFMYLHTLIKVLEPSECLFSYNWRDSLIEGTTIEAALLYNTKLKYCWDGVLRKV